jgi:hypothetical protein
MGGQKIVGVMPNLTWLEQTIISWYSGAKMQF